MTPGEGSWRWEGLAAFELEEIRSDLHERLQEHYSDAAMLLEELQALEEHIKERGFRHIEERGQ